MSITRSPISISVEVPHHGRPATKLMLVDDRALSHRESCDELDTRKAQLESRAIQLSKDKSSRVKELDARLDASTRWFHHLQEDEIKRASRMQQESDCRRIKLESDHYVLVGSDRDSPVMVGTVMVWRHAPEDIPP